MAYIEYEMARCFKSIVDFDFRNTFGYIFVSPAAIAFNKFILSLLYCYFIAVVITY